MILYLMSVAEWGEEELDLAYQLLPVYWREKAEGNRGFRNKALSAASSLLLAEGLAEKGHSLSALKVEKGPYGKPFFPACKQFHFSISHSNFYAVCAVGTKPLGIDIERAESSRRDSMKLAERFFHPQEFLQLRESENRDRDFFRLWTLKESYIKFTGDGMHRPLHSFCVTLGDPSHMEGEPALRFSEWDFLPGYRIAMCTAESGPVEIKELSLRQILGKGTETEEGRFTE